jgi:DNA-binding NarL/FixJ family response regulator
MIVDDDLFVRTLLSDILGHAEGIEVMGAWEDGAAAARAAADDPPDVALVDIVMPLLDGPETTRRLRAASPTTQVLALTSLADPQWAAAMLDAGALGFLPKDLALPAMVHSIQTARYGVAVLAGGAFGLLAGRQAKPEPPALNETEIRILELVLAGRTNNEIARQVYLSPSTVKHQVSALMERLGATNRVTLAIRARELGIG